MSDVDAPPRARWALGYAAAALAAATSLLWGATLTQLRPRDAGTASYRSTMTAVFLVATVLFAVLLGAHYLRRACGHLPARRPPRVRRSTLVAAGDVALLCVVITIKNGLPATACFVLLTALGWLATAVVLDRREYRDVQSASEAGRAGRVS